MPFTPAHPAIVLPFLKLRYFSATGLVVGCMTPDFEYFFKMSVDAIHSHSTAGLFYFDLPVTLILSVVFHQFVKSNFIQNLPLYIMVKEPVNMDVLLGELSEVSIEHSRYTYCAY